MSLGFIALLVAGCYTLQPAMSGPDVGSALALDINDVGRVALGGTIGQGIGQLEGRLIGSDDGEYLIAVTSVRYLSGGEQIWGGERVRIRKEYVGNTYERRFNKGRTVALGATLAADRKSTRLNSSHERLSRMPSSA